MSKKTKKPICRSAVDGKTAALGFLSTSLVVVPPVGGKPLARGASLNAAWSRTGGYLQSATRSMKSSLKHG